MLGHKVTTRGIGKKLPNPGLICAPERKLEIRVVEIRGKCYIIEPGAFMIRMKLDQPVWLSYNL